MPTLTRCKGSPTLLSTFNFDTNTNLTSIEMVPCCKYVYTLAFQNVGSASKYYKFQVIDVSNAASPTVTGSLTGSWSTTISNYFYPLRATIYDNHVYLFGSRVNGGTGNWQFEAHVIDVSDPTAPVEAGSWTVTDGGTTGANLPWSTTLFESQGKLYVGALLQWYDASNRMLILEIAPTSYTYKSLTTISSDSLYASYKNSHFYIACRNTTHGDLKVLDVSNVSSPVLTNHASFYTHYPFAVDIVGDTFWMTDSINNLVATDITALDSPVLGSSYALTEGTWLLGHCNQVLYVLYFDTDISLQGWNVTNPASASALDTLVLSNTGDVEELFVTCGRVYINWFRDSDFAPELVTVSS